jgi:hypothetical protein
MTEKSDALRLADAMTAQVEVGGGDLTELEEAAAELRRLHAVNAELLEALKDALFHVTNQGDIGVDQWLACERKARAAIAKATEEPK